MARILARPGMDRKAAAMLLARQVPDEHKRARGTWVIPTVTLDGARAAVRGILREIRESRHA
jgi:dephospho-CoA kinase